jgi:hypothetical protein
MEVPEDQTKLANPPAEWINGNPLVRVWGIFDQESGRWQALLPDFSIGGQGATFEDASAEALELVRDHLRVAYRDGLTFAQAHHRLSRSYVLRLHVGEILRSVTGKLRRQRDGFRHEEMRLAI